MHPDGMAAAAAATLTAFGLKVLGAFIAWLVGRYLIRLSTRLIAAGLERQGVDPTLRRYAAGVIGIMLNIALVVALLGYFGVETTTFAALVAAVGVAIGAAWAGLLANFAAGAFLIVLRPFKIGDYVRVAGIEGTVVELGLFATTLRMPDNVSAFIGNNKVFADTIQNLSAEDFRRVERTAQIAHAVNVQEAAELLRQALPRIPNVRANPAPEVEIVDFTARGPVLTVRAYTHTDHYWQVYFALTRLIAEAFDGAGYPVPEEHLYLRQAR